MILSNNHATYISIAIQHRKYGTGIYYKEYGTGIYKKYRYRWVGPSAIHTSNLRLALWTKNDIKNLRSNL